MDRSRRHADTDPLALVLSGGMALAAYQAGAYAALDEAGLGERIAWLAGTSGGALNAAIIAGNRPEHRVERLRRFWREAASDPLFLAAAPSLGPWRQAYAWGSALQTRLFGRPGLFHPRLMPGAAPPEAPGIYDHTPLAARLAEVVDFDRLNRGDVRLSVVATDVETGEAVVFDTGRGARIEPRHLLASGAQLPDFPPMDIDGRWLADGGLVANAPVDLVLDGAPELGACIVVDLFARRGSRPHSLLAASARQADLMYGNQSHQILSGRRREYGLRALLGRLASRLPADLQQDPAVAAALAEGRERTLPILYLSYRAPLDEAGPEKGFDFSSSALARRWEQGRAEMRAALPWLAATPAEEAEEGLVLHHAPP